MNKLLYINQVINNIVWGKYMICFLLFTGVWYMFATSFLPLRYISLIIKKTIGSLFHKKSHDGVTPFQAVATALGGTLGVGSIVGVTTAISTGGAGALLWMCISAFFGMIIKYAEIVLAIHFRDKQEDGSYIGGAMNALEKGCHMPFLAVLFALFCIFASFGIGNITPANTIAETVRFQFQIDETIIGIAVACICAFVFLGKAKMIMKVNEIIIPLVSLVYIICCIYLILLHSDRILPILKMIWHEAFHFSSVSGGIGGYTLQKTIHYGISRGVFSNEAGMGSSPISHAAVADVNAVEQGFWGVFEVFFDTMVVCMLTGIMVLVNTKDIATIDGVGVVIQCFADGFGHMGGLLFCFSIICFALPSIFGWYYYAIVCIRYIWKQTWVQYVYLFIFLMFLIMGCRMDLRAVWEVADTLNGLMAIPNLISLVFLYKTVVKLTQIYVKENVREYRSD